MESTPFRPNPFSPVQEPSSASPINPSSSPQTSKRKSSKSKKSHHHHLHHPLHHRSHTHRHRHTGSSKSHHTSKKADDSSSSTSEDKEEEEEEEEQHGEKEKAEKHRRHHSRRSRHRHAKSVVQSAVQLHPPTSFGDLLKQASRSKNSSPTRGSSRRGSGGEKGEGDGAREEEAAERVVRVVRAEDVERERGKARAGEEALRKNFQSLADASLKTSRQLDDTYYSILEKLSALRQTIGSLQELCALTKQLHSTFDSDTAELTDDIKGQFEAFSNFSSQEKLIDELESRIQAGKTKADALAKRLDSARRRVEAREKVEREWETRTNRRMKMVWGILGTVAALMLLAVLFQQLRPLRVDTDPHHAGLDFESRSNVLNAPIPDDAKEAILKPFPARVSQESASDGPTSVQVGEDSRLRVFDEL